MTSAMADVIGIRDDMFIGEGHKYQKTFMDALDEGYRDGILEQRPTLVNLQCDVDHPTQCGRYAPHDPSVRRRGEPKGQEDRYDLGLFSLLRQAPVRPAGRHSA